MLGKKRCHSCIWKTYTYENAPIQHPSLQSKPMPSHAQHGASCLRTPSCALSSVPFNARSFPSFWKALFLSSLFKQRRLLMRSNSRFDTPGVHFIRFR